MPTPMLFGAASLRAVDALCGRLARDIKGRALAAAREAGRQAVTTEDIRDACDAIAYGLWDYLEMEDGADA